MMLVMKFDIPYPEELHELHNDLPFFPEIIKIKQFKKLARNLHDKAEYVILMRNLKQALNHKFV